MTETTMKNDPKRATGRTLGLVLQALGKAVENPGTEVEFIDHYAQNHAQLQYCKERIEKIAKQLNLDISVIVKLEGKRHFYQYHSLYVKSNWVSPYSKRTPAEEAYKRVHGVYPSFCTDWEIFEKAFNLGLEAAQK